MIKNAKIYINIFLIVFLAACIVSVFKTYRGAKSIELKAKGAQEYPDDMVNANYKSVDPLGGLKKLEARAIAPVKFLNISAGNYFVDFGRAAFGTLRVQVEPMEQAYTVDIRIGEKAVDGSRVWFPTNGDHYPSRVAYFSTKVTINKGDKEIVVKVPPRFRPGADQLPKGVSSVMPFRYAEILGLKRELVPEAVSQLMVRYPANINSSYFESSDSILNQVWDLGRHTLDATTYAQLFVDGNRERKPYEADAYINQMGYYAISNDNLLARNTLNYLLENPTWPTEWTFYTIFIAYEDYQRTGDLSYLKSIYSKLQRNLLDDLIRPDGLISTKGEFAEKSQRIRGYKPIDIVDWPPSERDGYDTVRVEFIPYVRASLEYFQKKIRKSIANFFGMYSAVAVYKDQENNANLKRHELPKVNTVVNLVNLEAVKKMAYISKVTGNHDDKLKYDDRIKILEGAIKDTLISSETNLFVDGQESIKSSLHANMYALAFGVVPFENSRQVQNFIISRGMACSVFGSQFLLDGLYRNRLANEALTLMTSQTPRSWWAMMHTSGSTMTMESWSSEVNPDTDWNHAWGTAPVNIISRWLVGVRPLEAGYKKIIIDPQPAGMTYFKAKVPLGEGYVLVNYNFDQKGLQVLEVDIPKGVALAEIYMPVKPHKWYEVITVDSKMNYLSKGNRLKIGDFKSGHYKFHVKSEVKAND